jgi:hypothetical protein
VGTQLTVRLLPPSSDDGNPVTHFLDSVSDLLQYALRDCEDSDIEGVTIRNEVNVQDKAIGLSFRRKDQISADVILSVWEKVTQSNSRFNALDTLVLQVHSVKMPVGFGRAVKTRGRPLSVLAHLKKSIVKVKSETNCLAHAILIAIAKITNDPNYTLYRKGNKLGPAVNQLLQTTGINLDRGGGVRELMRFQEHFQEYRIIVFSGLNCENIYFDGQVESEKRINLLYDEAEHHYHVITNITGAMAKRYMCRG